MNYSVINTCPITDSNDKITYIDLGNFPLVNNLCDSKEESYNCDRYPLKVNFYPKSNLSSLEHAVDGSLLFSNYLYKSNVNVPYINHCKNMFDYISTIVSIKDNDLFVDIGGNDGTLLSAFKSKSTINLNYLNIDPSENLVKESEAKGIPVLNKFFSNETVKLINRKAKVITSTNVFQHLKDINSFVQGITNLLEDDGIWILEFPYWIHDLETKQFDQIYHEHVYYYSVTPLNMLMKKHGLKIINIERQSIHGGTLRITIAKENSQYKQDNSIDTFLINEEKYNIDYYKQWFTLILGHLINCKNIVMNLKRSGARIAAFGAAAKGCIFLNAAGIDSQYIDFIIDDTDIKQNKYMPGTGIEILGRDKVNLKEIDYIIILTHNFSEYIIKSFNQQYDGKFIVFLPEIKII